MAAGTNIVNPSSSKGQRIALVPGAWYGDNFQSNSNGIVQNTCYLWPVCYQVTHTFQGIGCINSAGGGTGSVVRFAVYKDNGAGYPGGLIIDAGTAVSTGGGGVTVATSFTLAGGQVYWLAMTPQGGSGPTVQSEAAHMGFLLGLINLNQTLASYSFSPISGVHPATFPAGATLGANPPVVYVQA